MLIRPNGFPRRRPLVALSLVLTLTLGVAPAAAAQSLSTPVGGTAGSLGSLTSVDVVPAPEPEPEPEPAVYPEYVALGDSYAALGANSQPAGGPATCARSLANYPHQLAATEPRVGELTDASCSGAVVQNLFSPRRAGIPAQLDALTPTTELVTLSIGGNDIGFGDMVYCLALTPRQDESSPCREKMDITVTAAIAALAPTLDEVYSAIATRSPGATVVATQYMPILPATGGCEISDMWSPRDVDWAREKTAQLNAAVDAAATRNGHVSVMPSPLEGRSACAPASQRYTDFNGLETDAQPMHPTALGQQAMAHAIAAVL